MISSILALVAGLAAKVRPAPESESAREQVLATALEALRAANAWLAKELTQACEERDANARQLRHVLEDNAELRDRIIEANGRWGEARLERDRIIAMYAGLSPDLGHSHAISDPGHHAHSIGVSVAVVEPGLTGERAMREHIEAMRAFQQFPPGAQAIQALDQQMRAQQALSPGVEPSLWYQQMFCNCVPARHDMLTRPYRRE